MGRAPVGERGAVADGRVHPHVEELARAAGYLKALGAGDEAQLLRWCAANEGVDGRTFAAFCVEARRLLTDALCCRSSLKGLTRGDMLRLCGLMETLIRYQKVNTGVKQLFGLLAVDSLGGSET